MEKIIKNYDISKIYDNKSRLVYHLGSQYKILSKISKSKTFTF